MAYIYRICIKGQLDEQWAAWFDGLQLVSGEDGVTSLVGPVVDQAALHGLLARIRDLGLPIISITSLEHDMTDHKG